MSATQEIKIVEFNRNTTGGKYTYAMYRGKIVRRAYGRGRPHYEAVSGLKVTEHDRQKVRKVNVNSQVARVLLATA